MGAYGVIYDAFFDGPTGVAIRELGGAAGQLCATYLLKNKQDNMIGLYALDLAVMRHTIGSLNADQVTLGMIACGQATFADYDTVTGYVWVRELAKYRLNLTKGPLKPDDNRAVGAEKLYRAAKANPFLAPFFRKYRKDLGLSKTRTYEGASQPLVAAAKPVISNQEITEQKIQIKSDQEDQKHRADARPSHDLLVKLWHGVFDDSEAKRIPYTDLASLAEMLKTRAAQARLDYGVNPEAIANALDSCLKQRAKRRSA